MTKEMRPSHRVDILSHALLYYGTKTKQKLRKWLLVIRIGGWNLYTQHMYSVTAC